MITYDRDLIGIRARKYEVTSDFFRLFLPLGPLHVPLHIPHGIFAI